MSNLRLKDHTWDAANVYDSSLGKTQEQINAEVGTSLAGKQGTLVSGENIKTVNGASILGSGNIEIQGGGTGEDGYSPVVTISNITGGHRVNITDKTHQQGQNFDVMDGAEGDPAPASAVVPAVEAWLEDNITQETGYVIDDSLTVAGAAADAKKTGDELSDLKSAVTITKTGVPADFTNNYLTNGGNEEPSTKLALSKRCFNYQQDKLLSVETTAPYGIYAYGFKRQNHLGLLRENGTFATSSSSSILYADKINLSDYPDITFKFGLRHNENGTSLDVTTAEAVNLKFTFELNRELARRKISVIGDSISTFTGYTSPGAPSAYYPSGTARMYYVENMYWKTLADRNDMDIEVIDAYGGSTVADKWQTSTRVPFYDDSRVNSLGDPDVIIVEGGINDFGGNPLGDYPVLGDYTKTYEFRSGYSLLLNKLKNKYKNATIVCLSMTSPRTYNNTTFPEKQTEVNQALATDTTPHAFAEFNESIEHIAKQYQCAYCDITDLLNYYISPNSSLGPHWYFNLHLDVAYRIEQKLKEIFR